MTLECFKAYDIRSKLGKTNQLAIPAKHDTLSRQSIIKPYVMHLLTCIDPAAIKPLKLVINAGNGTTEYVIDALKASFKQQGVPISFIKVHYQPDGFFPNDIPNPLLPENRAATAEAVRAHHANMSIAWDGDFDRCFLFDENGEFIEDYYIVDLLTEAFPIKRSSEKIIHGPRPTWNAIDIIKSVGGMIPWLLVAELMSRSDKKLSPLVSECINAYPCSDEINYHMHDMHQTTECALQHYQLQHPIIDCTDGLNVEFADWPFNLRSSNTEPLLRFNVDTRNNSPAVLQHVRTIEILIVRHG